MIIAKIPATTHGQSAPRVYEGFIITLKGFYTVWGFVFGLIKRMFEPESIQNDEKTFQSGFSFGDSDFPL